MFIKESIYRIIIIAMIVFFAAGLFITVRFLRQSARLATSPNEATLKTANGQFNQKAYDEVIKRLGIK